MGEWSGLKWDEDKNWSHWTPSSLLSFLPSARTPFPGQLRRSTTTTSESELHSPSTSKPPIMHPCPTPKPCSALPANRVHLPAAPHPMPAKSLITPHIPAPRVRSFHAAQKQELAEAQLISLKASFAGACCHVRMHVKLGMACGGVDRCGGD